MELVRQLLIVVHLAAGVAALFLFWVPALSRKGSPLHRRTGRWYVNAMAIVTVTGFVLAGFFLFVGRVQAGLFLMFLGVITGTSLWNGWRVLRAKADPAAYTGPAHTLVALVNVLGGLALIVGGIVAKAPLLYAFGPIGLLIGGAMLARAWRSCTDPRYWLQEHFTGMIGSGIASHVAFLAFGGRQLFGWQIGQAVALWIAPVVVGVVAIVALSIYYGRKPAAAARLAPNASG